MPIFSISGSTSSMRSGFSILLILSDHSVTQLFFMFLLGSLVFFWLSYTIFHKFFQVSKKTIKQLAQKFMIYLYFYLSIEILIGYRLFVTNLSYVEKITTFVRELIVPTVTQSKVASPYVYSSLQSKC